MTLLPAFHEVSFPLSVALGATGGPERRTEIVVLASGREVRNGRWADSRRRYDAGSGVRSLDDLARVIAFFEERRGRLHGFRFRDRADCRSGAPSAALARTDQRIGTGDGATRIFQLTKTYGASFAPYVRRIVKPVAETVVVAVNGAAAPVTVDGATGLVTFAPANTPPPGAAVTAGFLFDVPVRFDTDALTVNLSGFSAGEIPRIPLIEVLP
ncbi:phage distal tail protein, Rcc01695 family [Chthonobacter rhizosphaerae]|uniref:phage distal tail protein, Rcc01695 family n=1 Tax=Chthonobacter rhizosphaerae TaxID=2735553 RepID=UPI0015EED62D